MVSRSTVHSRSERETIRLGEAIGSIIRPKDVVLLMGELGTGKTRLAKGVVSAATGTDPDEVVSPTFTLVNRFEGMFPVYHADLYRLQGHQIEETGIDEAFEESGAIIVEWGGKGRFKEGEQLRVIMEYTKTDGHRNIIMEWSPHGTWHERMCLLIGEWKASYEVVP